jgi:arginine N-succinyltransferase
VRNIRTVRESLELTLSLGSPDEQAPLWLIHNRRLENCRITVARARRVGSSLVIDRLTAKRLQLQPGNSVRAAMLPNQQQQAVAA